MGTLIDSLTRRPALLGAVLALLVGLLTFGYVRDASIATPAHAPAAAHGVVLVARHDLAAGAPIAATDVELRDLPAEAILPAALRATDGAVGHYAAERIAAGEQVLAGAVAAEAPGSTLAREVPDGQRAISVAISDAIAAGGLVAPGDRVDVVAVFDQQHAHRDGSSLVVDNVEVLAVSAAVLGNDATASTTTGTASGAKPGANPKQLTATVTLAVSPVQAQRLAIAEEFGSLRITLRRPGDDAPSNTGGLDLAAVTGAAATAAASAAPAATATPAAAGTGGS